MKIGANRTKDNIFLSFIVPTYLRVETIGDTVNSILNLNNLSNIRYEIIVIDNSGDISDDNKTYQLLKNITCDCLYYFVNEENLGMEGNWNRGVELAKGTYISFLHDDDLLDKDYLNNIIKCIDSIQEIDKLGFIKVSHRIFYSSKELPTLKKEKKLLLPSTLFEAVLTGAGPTSTPSCGIIFTKKAIRDIGGFDPQLYPVTDSAVGLYILDAGYLGFKTCSELGYYRIGVNESLNLSTIQSFVRMKVDVRKSSYKMVWYGRIYERLFEPVQYSVSIDFWVEYAREKCGQNISIEDLDYQHSYRKRIIGKFVLKVLCKLYRVIIFHESIIGRKMK